MKKLFILSILFYFSNFCYSQNGEFYNLYFEGNALSVKGQYEKAIEKYNQALKLFEKDYVYYNLGNAYYGKKDYANAIINYNKALKMNERYAEAYCQRGLIKIATHDNTACDDIKKAAKLELEDAKTALKANCK